MVLYMGKESAAGKNVGTDILADNDEPWRVSAQPRVLTHVALVGGNAAREFLADIVVGQKVVATLYCSESGASDRDWETKQRELIP